MEAVEQRYTMQELKVAYIISVLEDVAKAKDAEARIDVLPEIPEGAGCTQIPVDGRVLRAIAAYKAA